MADSANFVQTAFYEVLGNSPIAPLIFDHRETLDLPDAPRPAPF
jgi:hypothetical protein